MNKPQDIEILKKLTDVLDRLNIAYVIGGSMASSAYGTARFTQDSDITVEPFGQICDKLYEQLKDDFYISKSAMYQALQNTGSFNIIHLETAFKIDIFIQPKSEFFKQIFSRSRKLRLGNIKKEVSFVSPEDIILLKLKWYKQSGCDSQRQWTDVLGVLAVQKKLLDFDYLNNWAKKLELKELLQKAMLEAGMN